VHCKIARAIANEAFDVAGLAAEFYRLAFRRDRA
jgi:hypothetical protein